MLLAIQSVILPHKHQLNSANSMIRITKKNKLKTLQVEKIQELWMNVLCENENINKLIAPSDELG